MNKFLNITGSIAEFTLKTFVISYKVLLGLVILFFIVCVVIGD